LKLETRTRLDHFSIFGRKLLCERKKNGNVCESDHERVAVTHHACMRAWVKAIVVEEVNKWFITENIILQ
jgi:hypothetical protein